MKLFQFFLLFPILLLGQKNYLVKSVNSVDFSIDNARDAFIFDIDGDGNKDIAVSAKDGNYIKRFEMEDYDPEISRVQISPNNRTVSVTFTELVYGGTAQSSSTLNVNDFSLSISGGQATLNSSTPTSITISGTIIGLEIPF